MATMMMQVVAGPNDHHVVDKERGTMAPGLGKEADAVREAHALRKMQQMGVVMAPAAEVAETPTAKKLKEQAKLLADEGARLEALRAELEAKEAALASAGARGAK